MVDADLSPEPEAVAEPVRVPVYCWACDSVFAVRRSAYRVGGVLRCARCRTSFVVQTRAEESVHARLAEFDAGPDTPETRAALTRDLEKIAREVWAPGRPRKPAGIFG